MNIIEFIINLKAHTPASEQKQNENIQFIIRRE